MENRPIIEQFLATRTEEAFCALFELVCVRVRRYFLLRGLDAATADELTQNVMLKVYRQAGELRNPDQFYAWLFTITRNELVSFWRGQQSRIETVGLETLPNEHAARLTVESTALPALRLMEWLKAIDPADRDLVVLRFVEGLSYEELAAVFSLPLGTIKWRIFNARKKLAMVINPSSDKNLRNQISGTFQSRENRQDSQD